MWCTCVFMLAKNWLSPDKSNSINSVPLPECYSDEITWKTVPHYYQFIQESHSANDIIAHSRLIALWAFCLCAHIIFMAYLRDVALCVFNFVGSGSGLPNGLESLSEAMLNNYKWASGILVFKVISQHILVASSTETCWKYIPQWIEVV